MLISLYSQGKEIIVTGWQKSHKNDTDVSPLRLNRPSTLTHTEQLMSPLHPKTLQD